MKKFISKRKIIINNNHGSALIWTMMLMFLYLLVISTVTTVIIADIRQTTSINTSVQAYYAVETGTERAINYANANTSVASKTGYMGGNGGKYTFGVAQAGNNYDTPPRQCSSQYSYCYYSVGEIGNLKRKIDGYTIREDPNNAKVIDMHNVGVPPTYTNVPPPPPGTLSIPGWAGIWIDGAPGNPTFNRLDSLIGEPRSFQFSGNIRFDWKPGSRSGGIYTFGPTDGGNFPRIWINNRESWACPNVGAKDASVSLGIPSDGHSSKGSDPQFQPVSSANKCIYLENASGGDVNDFSYVFTYNEKGSVPRVTLKITDNATGECLGVISYDYWENMDITNAHVWFDNNYGNGIGHVSGGTPYIWLQPSVVQDKAVDFLTLKFRYGDVTSSDTLASSETLTSGDKIVSPNGRYTLTYQSDGKLALLDNSTEIWSSESASESSYRLSYPATPAGVASMQAADGNLVVYNSSWQPRWNSKTTSYPGAYLKVGDDGKARIYDSGGTARWTRP